MPNTARDTNSFFSDLCAHLEEMSLEGAVSNVSWELIFPDIVHFRSHVPDGQAKNVFLAEVVLRSCKGPREAARLVAAEYEKIFKADLYDWSADYAEEKKRSEVGLYGRSLSGKPADRPPFALARVKSGAQEALLQFFDERPPPVEVLVDAAKEGRAMVEYRLGRHAASGVVDHRTADPIVPQCRPILEKLCRLVTKAWGEK